MSNLLPTQPTVIFFGMRCAFSVPPLRALIDSGISVSAIVLPGLPGDPPVVTEPPRPPLRRLPMAGSGQSIDDLAAAASIPIVRVRKLRHPDVVAYFQSLKPEIIAAACFPRLIPLEIRTLAKLASVNVHPSLLPRWRGADPLFWTFKSGDPITGTTIHRLDDGYDTGAILRQRSLPVPTGVDGRSLERELAELGGELLVEAISDIRRGTMSPVDQAEVLATLAPTPKDGDFEFSSDLPAVRIFNAVRGIVPLWGPLHLKIAATGDRITVNRALLFDANGLQRQPVVIIGDRVTVQCNPGIVTLLRSSTPS